jgi:hypothetical protein
MFKLFLNDSALKTIIIHIIQFREMNWINCMKPTSLINFIKLSLYKIGFVCSNSNLFHVMFSFMKFFYLIIILPTYVWDPTGVGCWLYAQKCNYSFKHIKPKV